jgi:hypothetical protein
MLKHRKITRRKNGKWLGIGGKKSTDVAIYQPRTPSTRVLKRRVKSSYTAEITPGSPSIYQPKGKSDSGQSSSGRGSIFNKLSTKVFRRPSAKQSKTIHINVPPQSSDWDETLLLKGGRGKKSAGAIAAQKRLVEIRKAQLAERKRLAEIKKFQDKAEVEEAKGRFLRATVQKRIYRRKASSLHPIGIAGSIAGRVIGSGVKKARKSKRKIGW